MKRILLASVLLISPACVMVPSQVERQIKSNVAVATANLREWDALTPDNHKQAYWSLARSMADLNYSINDVEIPEQYLNNPWSTEQVDEGE